jgi:hypothetical protein
LSRPGARPSEAARATENDNKARGGLRHQVTPWGVCGSGSGHEEAWPSILSGSESLVKELESCLFGVPATLLAVIGLYGLTSYSRRWTRCNRSEARPWR